MSSRALTPELVLGAYAQGIFPMSDSRDDPEIFWVDPQYRGVLPMDGLRISRSLRRHIRQGSHQVSFNRAFEAVVAGCADRPETWISDPIAALYSDLHRAGYAHSIEVWADSRLVGGVYGVVLGGAFFGESMFSKETNASKLALVYLMDRLRQGGFVLFDTQFITPHLQSMGGVEIPRSSYRHQLSEALKRQAVFSTVSPDSPDQVLQRMTQTS
ncbi:leucyl/phenylalanyl-tRNA--protein transferase [Palleronia caenipelagi]|uniref:Leucyl/phenylalanyl-tRNA--protein transferase n=1 Tax=Palleronia caenipelagi TaxID=2489174 RepID=A0A547PRB5_9RHOB|nr:leucyl/phenylalanyl-tRNA--protein transferase [Palleronia caenipelagi]TRD16690.1 leucyl/phenylalanyl-tRNA--protein transferase [Palleronia caenipelagi]